jgi:hypothetical protein
MSYPAFALLLRRAGVAEGNANFRPAHCPGPNY